MCGNVDKAESEEKESFFLYLLVDSKNLPTFALPKRNSGLHMGGDRQPKRDWIRSKRSLHTAQIEKNDLKISLVMIFGSSPNRK